jgi:hypothetical protein
VHYDLRLQFSETSTISFAIPYGLPGNPNSLRPNRMAIETRVHNLWNNLVESASHSTGSLLIWDTGEYEVLPYRETPKARTTDDECSDPEAQAEKAPCVPESESEKLFAGFQARHIRLRLHGTRLPRDYAISLRLPSDNNRSGQPEKPKRKRRKVDPSKVMRPAAMLTDSEADTPESELGASTSHTDAQPEDAAVASEAEEEDAAIRSNNAYTGATNTIGSVHQRHWFLSLDRKLSGFHKARSGVDEGRWVGERDTFLVLGRDVERSVVSGRLADEVMSDEGVIMFQGRKMWRAITE